MSYDGYYGEYNGGNTGYAGSSTNKIDHTHKQKGGRHEFSPSQNNFG